VCNKASPRTEEARERSLKTPYVGRKRKEKEKKDILGEGRRHGPFTKATIMWTCVTLHNIRMLSIL
jgi:hypothetical protein